MNEQNSTYHLPVHTGTRPSSAWMDASLISSLQVVKDTGGCLGPHQPRGATPSPLIPKLDGGCRENLSVLGKCDACILSASGIQMYQCANVSVRRSMAAGCIISLPERHVADENEKVVVV